MTPTAEQASRTENPAALEKLKSYEGSAHYGERALGKFFMEKTTNWRLGVNGLLVGDYEFNKDIKKVFLGLSKRPEGVTLDMFLTKDFADMKLNATTSANGYLRVVAGLIQEADAKRPTLRIDLPRNVDLRTKDAHVIRYFLDHFLDVTQTLSPDKK